MTSLIIPTTSKNKDYTQNILNNIREIYPNENEVEIIIEENDNVTLGINYNNAVAKANGEKIVLLHNDMVIKPGFVETMDKHIVKNRITKQLLEHKFSIPIIFNIIFFYFFFGYYYLFIYYRLFNFVYKIFSFLLKIKTYIFSNY